MKKIVSALFVVISMAVMSMPASADTYNLTLTAAGPANTNSIYIYPYTFTVVDKDSSGNVVSTTPGVQMMCVDFDREIWQGENWNANLYNVGTDTPPSADDPHATTDQLKALARIYAAMTASITAGSDPNGYTTSEYQFAAWSIITPTTVTNGSYSGYDANAKAIAKEATDDVADGLAFDYQNYSYYDPIAGSQVPFGDGAPQRFMVYTGSTPDGIPSLTATPEPSSLMLLGTGVLGVAGMARRRFVKA